MLIGSLGLATRSKRLGEAEWIEWTLEPVEGNVHS